MTIGVYSRGVSFLYAFEILKWGKKVTFKKWKFGQNFQRHFIRPKSMGLQHFASTLSTRAYILTPELLVIKNFLRNRKSKKVVQSTQLREIIKWCFELKWKLFSSQSSLTLLMSAHHHFVTTSIDDDELTSFGFV